MIYIKISYLNFKRNKAGQRDAKQSGATAGSAVHYRPMFGANDRLARSVPDARAIGDELAVRGVKLQLGASVHDPSDPMGKLIFNILATFAEFEADLIRSPAVQAQFLAGKKAWFLDRAQLVEPVGMDKAGFDILWGPVVTALPHPPRFVPAYGAQWSWNRLGVRSRPHVPDRGYAYLRGYSQRGHGQDRGDLPGRGRRAEGFWIPSSAQGLNATGEGRPDRPLGRPVAR